MHGCIYNRRLFLHGTHVFFNRLPFMAYRMSHISGYYIVHFYKNVYSQRELKHLFFIYLVYKQHL